MCLRARKTKRYGQRVPIVSYYVVTVDITWDLCFKQALQFQKPKTKGRQIWPPPWRPKVLLPHCSTPLYFTLLHIRTHTDTRTVLRPNYTHFDFSNSTTCCKTNTCNIRNNKSKVWSKSATTCTTSLEKNRNTATHPQRHNTSRCRPSLLYDLSSNKSTTSRSGGVWAITNGQFPARPGIPGCLQVDVPTRSQTSASCQEGS